MVKAAKRHYTELGYHLEAVIDGHAWRPPESAFTEGAVPTCGRALVRTRAIACVESKLYTFDLANDSDRQTLTLLRRREAAFHARERIQDARLEGNSVSAISDEAWRPPSCGTLTFQYNCLSLEFDPRSLMTPVELDLSTPW